MNNALKQIEAGEFFLIAGPCAAESEQLCLSVAEKVAALADRFNLPYIFMKRHSNLSTIIATEYSICTCLAEIL